MLNEKKCKFSVPEVNFFSKIINKSGVSPDPEKVKVITEQARTNRHQQGATISQNGQSNWKVHSKPSGEHETHKRSSEQEERLDMGP